ncbi:ABC transporter permease [Saccharothrix violaceirubra]|uniref:ABC-2 type transport system permease protein n=1 Tax=Saccharothrix violaceirubra TaxID=413306 RepID=A0A7W7WV16_9PSEU|nr:ABC transporter permease [Saccharothrix violaceirubra]MBB4964835.1 ABC-2 type transport system permease protein [Saccharothrix violaceirubra]
MNGRTTAVRAGVRRGRIEFGHGVTNVPELIGWLWLPVLALVVLSFLDGDSGIPVGSRAVPGVLGMNVLFTAVLGLAVALVTDREDGTLLRARATPNGVLGYLVGRVAAKALMTLLTLVLVLVPGVLLFDGVAIERPVTLVWVVVLGLVATLPLGAALGALFANPQSLGFITMLLFLLMAVSGVFQPLTSLPGWLQVVGQAFPIYWLGLGMRSALVPDAWVVAEVGGSWRPWETVLALGLWTVLGFALALPALRRAARRESGSRVAARRQKALNRGM